MAWNYTDGTEYIGGVHVIAGTTFSGVTRTPSSRRLIEAPEREVAAVAKVVIPSKPRKPREKRAPKPKGASAWD